MMPTKIKIYDTTGQIVFSIREVDPTKVRKQLNDLAEKFK